MPNEHITAAQQALREKDYLTIEESLNRITDYKNLTKEEHRLLFDLYLICASHVFNQGQLFKAHTLVQQAENCFFLVSFLKLN